MSVPEQAWTIGKATGEDIDELKVLADKHRVELGFTRKAALIRSAEMGELFVAKTNRRPIGFVQYHHRRDQQSTLHSIVVEVDHRGHGIGRALVEALLQEARAKGQQWVQLKCPEELAANQIYPSFGFERSGMEPGKARRLIIWRQAL